MTTTISLLHSLTLLEPWLNLLALLAALKAGLSKRFPAFTSYLGLRLVSGILLAGILNAHHFTSISVTAQTWAYVYTYWIAFIGGAVTIFFAVQEIFNELMSPLPGLRRLGILAFRWVSVAAVVISVGAVFPMRDSTIVFSAIGIQIMKCTSILEICLLAFLALTIHSLGRSFRSVMFGIGLGFGLEASSQLIASAFLARNPNLYSMGNLILEIVTIATFAMWTGYFLVPEPAYERSSALLPVSSPLIRWNEIAQALGHGAPHVALGSPSQAFFLQDVEQVVDKILSRNSVG